MSCVFGFGNEPVFLEKKKTLNIPITFVLPRYNSTNCALEPLKIKTWQQIYLKHFERWDKKGFNYVDHVTFYFVYLPPESTFQTSSLCVGTQEGKILFFPEESSVTWPVLEQDRTNHCHLVSRTSIPHPHTTHLHKAYARHLTLMCLGRGCVSGFSVFMCMCTVCVFNFPCSHCP